MKKTTVEKLEALYKHHYGVSIDEAYEKISVFSKVQEKLKPIFISLKGSESHSISQEKEDKLPEEGWLKSTYGSIIYRTGENSGYGINSSNQWDFSSDWIFASAWSIPTPEEVYDKLAKFALTKGYKTGVKVKCLFDRHVYTIGRLQNPHQSHIIIKGEFYVESADSILSICLMRDGKWAEIIEEENETPQEGDYVKAWDDNIPNEVYIGIYKEFNEERDHPHTLTDNVAYSHAKKITKEQYEQIKNL